MQLTKNHQLSIKSLLCTQNDIKNIIYGNITDYINSVSPFTSISYQHLVEFLFLIHKNIPQEIHSDLQEFIYHQLALRSNANIQIFSSQFCLSNAQYLHHPQSSQSGHQHYIVTDYPLLIQYDPNGNFSTFLLLTKSYESSQTRNCNCK